MDWIVYESWAKEMMLGAYKYDADHTTIKASEIRLFAKEFGLNVSNLKRAYNQIKTTYDPASEFE